MRGISVLIAKSPLQLHSLTSTLHLQPQPEHLTTNLGRISLGAHEINPEFYHMLRLSDQLVD